MTRLIVCQSLWQKPRCQRKNAHIHRYCDSIRSIRTYWIVSRALFTHMVLRTLEGVSIVEGKRCEFHNPVSSHTSRTRDSSYKHAEIAWSVSELVPFWSTPPSHSFWINSCGSSRSSLTSSGCHLARCIQKCSCYRLKRLVLQLFSSRLLLQYISATLSSVYFSYLASLQGLPSSESWQQSFESLLLIWIQLAACQRQTSPAN